jgi:hypothetical protein
MKRRTHEIAQGQLYRKVGRVASVWEVVAVKADASGAVHARMRSAEEPTTFRTVATEMLLDNHNFQLVGAKKL